MTLKATYHHWEQVMFHIQTSQRVLNAEWELQTRDLIKTSEQIRTARELQPLSSGYN